jgi:predicted protein tyrosine phosphatase
MNKSVKKILIKKILSENLTMRDRCNSFFEIINNSDEEIVEINFKDILFISRSFADEYLNLKSLSSKKISEINLPLNVKKMFEVVKKPRQDRNLNIHCLKPILV